MLGQDTAEPIGRDRLEFYEELAKEYAGDDVYLPNGVEVQTVNLTLGDVMSNKTWRLRDPIKEGLEPDTSNLLLVDLTLSEIWLGGVQVPQVVAGAVGESMSTVEGTQSIILLPDVAASDFLAAIPDYAPYEQAITVLTNSGQIIRLGRDGHPTEPNETSLEYCAALEEINMSVAQRFALKVVEHVGHYRFGTDAEHCASSFFDASFAIDEATQLVVEQLTTRHFTGPEFTIASFQKLSPWLSPVGAAAATQLGTGHSEIQSIDALNGRVDISGRVVVLVDIVNSQKTVKGLITKLRAQALQLEHTIIAIFAPQTEATVVLPQATYQVIGLHEVDRKKVHWRDCDRCAARVPHIDPLSDDFLGIRAYDMWDLLSEYAWEQESYGPHALSKFSSVPPFTKIFTRHGDWIAYKINRLLGQVEFTSSAPQGVVFVSPAESAMMTLMTRIKALRLNRPVAVHIPRSVLDQAATYAPKADPDADEGWERQLRLLAKSRNRWVVMIDEFNGSGHTAEAMRMVTKKFDIEPMAYLPVIDRNPNAQPSGINPCPLYTIDSPRPQTTR